MLDETTKQLIAKPSDWSAAWTGNSLLVDPTVNFQCVCGERCTINWPSWRTVLDFQCQCRRVWKISSMRTATSNE